MRQVPLYGGQTELTGMKTVYKYLITVAVGLVIAFLALLARDVFHLTATVDFMKAFCDAFFVSGVVITCVGGLVFVSNGGVFDMIAYGVRTFFESFKRNVTDRKYRTYYDYKESKKDRKTSFGYLLIVGVIFIVVSLVFLFLYYKYLPA